MGKKMTVFSFRGTLDEWQLAKIQQRGTSADNAKKRLRKRLGRRFVGITLVGSWNPNTNDRTGDF